MPSPDRQLRLAALRETIADIERKPQLQPARAAVAHDPGRFPLPGPGFLQEVFSDERRHAGTTLAFALAQAKNLLTPQRPAIVYLQLAHDSQEMGLPYGPGLVSFGFDPDALVLVRVANMVELLWAAEEAVACKAVAAVVADIAAPHKILDFTASRRLSLRAASSGGSILLLRYGAGREASAAQFRWRLTPAASGRKRYDALAPGPPRWRAQLEKGILRNQQTEWLLGWTENGLTAIDAGPRSLQRHPEGTALPRAVPAALANRLSETA